MALQIVLESVEAAPGESVRGKVRGLDAWPDARGARVALRHRTKNLKSSAGAEVELETGAPEVPFDLGVPDDAYPTFEGMHFRSGWVVEAVVDLAMRRDPSAEAALVVRPEVRASPPVAPATATWGGYARFRRFLGIFTVVDLLALGGVWTMTGGISTAVLFALLAPAAISLAALGLLAVAGSSVDRVEIHLPRKTWRFGETVTAEVVLEGDPAEVPGVTVTLTGEEVWTVSTGNAATTHREAVHAEERSLARAELMGVREGARRWTWHVELPLPPTGPPSRGKDVQWKVRASVPLPHRPDPAAALDLEVDGRMA